MEPNECSDFPVKENIKREDAELNSTEYFEFDSEIRTVHAICKSLKTSAVSPQ